MPCWGCVDADAVRGDVGGVDVDADGGVGVDGGVVLGLFLLLCLLCLVFEGLVLALRRCLHLFRGVWMAATIWCFWCCCGSPAVAWWWLCGVWFTFAVVPDPNPVPGSEAEAESESVKPGPSPPPPALLPLTSLLPDPDRRKTDIYESTCVR